MGHSRDQLLAVLDLSHRAFARRASIRIDGEAVPAHRLAGLVPFQMALVQAQAGLAIGQFEVRPSEAGLLTRRSPSDASLVWEVEGPVDGATLATQRSPLRTTQLRWRDGELTGATVTQWGRPAPVLAVQIAPALPDLRRRFEGRAVSRFAIDVNGQAGHAIGRIEAWWEADGPRVEVIPEAPWWTADRPMRTTIRYEEDRAEVTVERLPSAAPSGTGARNRSPVAR
jgi:hypothetical protein